MPKLNLDIFSQEDEPKRKEKHVPTDAIPASVTPRSQGSEPTIKGDNRSHNPSPKFVPVGFHAEHLQLLDDAVFELRRRNIYSASKSGIIRLLIELHRNDLVDIWLSGTKKGRGT
jgi:hypothetical protein